MIKVLFLLGCCAATATGATNWTFCKESSRLVEDVSVSLVGCQGTPCPVYRNHSHLISVRFIPKIATTHLYMKLYGKLNGLAIPYGPKKDACNLLTPPCDGGLSKDVLYNLKYMYPIPPAIPKIKVIATVQLLSPQDLEMLCVDIPLQLMDVPQGYKHPVPEVYTTDTIPSTSAVTTVIPTSSVSIFTEKELATTLEEEEKTPALERLEAPHEETPQTSSQEMPEVNSTPLTKGPTHEKLERSDKGRNSGTRTSVELMACTGILLSWLLCLA